ncbi:ABC transporter permease [Catellatospora citrea]|uniref:ABC transporter permease n=1 Tax=Catellatospora citrea TaxID=53366 RepID=A0A8J3KI60_9ACTN|nr:ABC transporter permease [Catellatospora citrea]RKE07763.1 putative ABC transport system permease protein [Catellatospora citrea]GIF99353.1 ABC transporter permease [Catellatospora citrea]
MRIGEAVRVAVGALVAARLRTALTMLGVTVGVGSVMVLIAIGDGTRQEVAGRVDELGSNLLLVVPGKIEIGMPTVSRMQLSDVAAVTRIVGDPSRVAASVASGEMVQAGTAKTFTTVAGVLENNRSVLVRELARGAYLSRTDVDSARRVAVLGASVARALYGGTDPVGRQITVAGVRFRVAGVFAPLGQSLGVDRDDEVHIPLTTAQRLFATTRVDGLAVRATDPAGMSALGDRIVAELGRRHPDSTFSVVTQDQVLSVLGDILDVLTGVLGATAGISLLVSGVGVANIMLVSVRERTREIGLRKAVGARPADIGAQFLAEAVLLTSAGGVLGIALGAAATLAVERFTPLPTLLTAWSVALSFGVAATVGLAFGTLPALHAARLDPVPALRTE